VAAIEGVQARSVAATGGGLRPGLLLCAVVFVAFNFRTPPASLPPLLGEIQPALGLSSTTAGLLTALPVLCMALCAPLALRLAHRIGREALTLLAVGLVAAGTLLRLGGGVTTVLFLSTALAGIGIAAGGVTLPGIVKDRFTNRPGMATAAYSVPMMLGSAIAPAAAVPARHTLGSWQASLASWAVPAAVAAAAWSPVARRLNRPESVRRSSPARLPWRSRSAWLLAAFMSAQSTLAYGYLAWLAPAYESRGWSPTTTGTLLGTLQLAQLVTALVLPTVAERRMDRRPVVLAAGACSITGALAARGPRDDSVARHRDPRAWPGRRLHARARADRRPGRLARRRKRNRRDDLPRLLPHGLDRTDRRWGTARSLRRLHCARSAPSLLSRPCNA
jgi:CP family cyanate transporter-like MFS transporter